MAKIDQLVENIRHSEPTLKGKTAIAEAKARAREVPEAQSLSKGYLPPTYRNHYAWLLANQPEKAQAFWDKWVVRPKR